MKTSISETLYGLISFVLFCFIIALLIMGFLTIFDMEVPLKTKGFVKYDFIDGLFFLLNAIILFLIMIKFIKFFKPKEILIEYSKCPKCKKSYNYSELKDGMCPTCNIKTIETEEYFKKFPEELEDI